MIKPRTLLELWSLQGMKTWKQRLTKLWASQAAPSSIPLGTHLLSSMPRSLPYTSLTDKGFLQNASSWCASHALVLYCPQIFNKKESHSQLPYVHNLVKKCPRMMYICEQKLHAKKKPHHRLLYASFGTPWKSERIWLLLNQLHLLNWNVFMIPRVKYM